VLSPGNATNVAFYATIAEELASHGYVVAGVDHPYQVAAVVLPDGTVASYDAVPDQLPVSERQAAVAAKIEERVADIRFVLDQLASLARDGSLLEGRLDLDQVGIMGHSNGGLAAVEACREDVRLRACLNVDGQQAGGPFSVAPGGVAPDQPFLFLTKETALHPALAERFEAAGEGAYRVVIPEARHEQFADGPLFQPALLPIGRPAERVLVTARGFAQAFFSRYLAGASPSVFSRVPAPADVYVNVYPLGGQPSLPVR
jgi:alpha-beta hydrolase superfamily lysophospholipase